MPKIDTNDYVGRKFGRLTVIYYAGNRSVIGSAKKKNVKHLYMVECQCGVRKVVQRDGLTSGSVRSCGCLSQDHHQTAMTKSFKKHRSIKRDEHSAS
jgi:hypothetical protein